MDIWSPDKWIWTICEQPENVCRHQKDLASSSRRDNSIKFHHSVPDEWWVTIRQCEKCLSCLVQLNCPRVDRSCPEKWYFKISKRKETIHQDSANNSTPLCYSKNNRRFVNYSCMNLLKRTPSYSTRFQVKYLYFRRIWRILVESNLLIS